MPGPLHVAGPARHGRRRLPATLPTPREGGCHRAPRRSRHGGGTPDAATDVVRWGAFCCALVPAVLLICGSSVPSALGTAAGLAAVTVACRMLLRRAKRARRPVLSGPALPPAARARHGKAYPGAHRSSMGPHRSTPGHRRPPRG